MKKVVVAALLVASVFLSGFSCIPGRLADQQTTNDMEVDMADIKETQVVKKILKNGLTVLVRPMHIVPKVSINLFYHVGSKDEQDSERGIAHLIEHMIFKGTDELSESDINVLTHKLSGYTNAFTSYDYTGYLFNFPTHHWHEAMPVMADCMRNVKFDENMLSSEMKAVIQELKMYRDKYTRTLIDEMMAAIFDGHPYHHPIIGYKKDLWSVHSQNLKDFYHKHYAPNNATLVIVGDVQPDEVFALVEQHFGDIPANENYKHQTFAFDKGVESKSVTLYRDVQQPTSVYAFLVPGAKEKKDYALNLLAWVLGKGKSSRLYRKFVDELQLATALSVSPEELFDHGMLLVCVQPKSQELIPEIEKILKEEIEKFVADGFTQEEFDRAVKQTRMEVYDLLEDIEHQAYEIGKYYLATGDENYVFTYANTSAEQAKKDMMHLAKNYLRPAVMHSGYVLPLPESERPVWEKQQEEADAEDQRILSARVRDTEIELPRYANELEIKEPGLFDYPKAQSFNMDNGLKVLWYNNTNTPKVNISLSLKAKYFYDPEDKQGLSRFVNGLLTEGTQNYTADKFADAVESRGISISTYPGGLAMSMLSEDFEFSLDLIIEMYTRALFSEDQIEKVRAQMLSRLKSFWDSPGSISSQLTKEAIYGDHPYHKNSLGSVESVKSITRDDLLNYYKKYFTPDQADLVVVGDLAQYDVPKLIEEKLGVWTGPKVEQMQFPEIAKTQSREIMYPMNRDQVVLAFASKSISRKHPDYDKLLLFNQIFGGGSLGSMSSRLFQLREQSGLFYTINGSLTAGADEQPGMVLVRTIVSNDRLAEAEKVIKETMDTAVDTITDDEFNEARRAVLNSLIDLFSSNESIASAFLFLERFDLPDTFFDSRARDLGAITKEEMRKVVKGLMSSQEVLTVRVGRVEGVDQA